MGSLNQHITPTGYRLGGTPVNSNPFWEDGGGNTKNITATASVDNTTGTPAVEVTKTETTEAVNFDFAFTGLKGAQGEKGDDGDTPEVSASAVVTDVGSTPSVSVINVGTTEAPNFQFTFDHIGGSGGGEEGTMLKKVNAGKFYYLLPDLIEKVFNDAFAASGAPGIEAWSLNYTGTIRVPVFGSMDGYIEPVYLPTRVNQKSVFIKNPDDQTLEFVNTSDMLFDGKYYPKGHVVGMLVLRKSTAGINWTFQLELESCMQTESINSVCGNVKVFIDGTMQVRSAGGPITLYLEVTPSSAVDIVDHSCSALHKQFAEDGYTLLDFAGPQIIYAGIVDDATPVSDLQYLTGFDTLRGTFLYLKPTSNLL